MLYIMISRRYSGQASITR